MSFKKMTTKELREVAELFGVEVAGLPKAKILETLEAEGVTYDAYETFASAEKVDPADEGYTPARQEPVGPLTLVKMDRMNPSYSIQCPSGTYYFTNRHPFVAVSEDDADFIFDTEEGFRPATPKEIKSYYG